jgi:hypothetical protein
MIPQQSSFSSSLVVIGSLISFLTPAPVFAAEPPKPTPRPGSLGAYAQKITLDRSALGDPTGRVILTNDNVVGIGEGATITLGSVVMPEGGSSKAPDRGNSAERSRWRAAHKKQRRVIADLERQRSLLEIDIDNIEDQRLTPKILIRLDRAESKLRHIDREIVRERGELARIVRDARRRGAEPGWFR